MRKLCTVLAAVALAGCNDYNLNPRTDAEGNNPDGDTALADSDEPGKDPEDTASPNGEGAGVTGRICDTSGNDWVVGATVWTKNSSGKKVETTTDADGRFTLSGLDPGTYTIYVEKGSFTTSFTVELKGGMYELPDPECLSTTEVKVAVVTGAYDSIEVVLDRLKIPYTKYDGEGWEGIQLMQDPAEMAKYDIIFFNCGMNDLWTLDQKKIAANVRDYVDNKGGSIYASDWAYYIVEAAWPKSIEFNGDDNMAMMATNGQEGEVKAKVLSSTMQAALGKSEAKINFDLGAWAVADSAASSTEVLLSGDVKTYMGTVKSSPLAVQIDSPTGGRVIFTAFHNERQTTDDMDHLLEEIIYSL